MILLSIHDLEKGEAYFSGGNCPDLEVVWSHEEIGDSDTGVADNPLVEVLGLRVGNSSLQGSIDHALHTLDLVILVKHGDVVLEGVRDPAALAADVGDTLVGVPVIFLGKSLIDAVVEVFVVGKDDVSADIVKLERKKNPPLVFCCPYRNRC